MCVTKKNYKTAPSTRQFERKDLANGGAQPAYTPANTVTPATKSTEGAATKSGTKGASKSKKVSKEKSKRNVQSDAEKKSEDQQEKVSELKKLADQATSMGHGPPVLPPIKRDAKRAITTTKDSKDVEYITLEEAVPDFAKAKLKGYNDEATLAEQQREKEKTLRVEATQPSSGEENKNKKTSAEKSSSAGGGASKE